MRRSPIPMKRLLEMHILNGSTLSEWTKVRKWKFYELRCRGRDAFAEEERHAISSVLYQKLGLEVEWREEP